jgi:hypothetical protein
MTSTPTPTSTSTIVEIDAGTGVPVTVDLGTANEHGDYDEAGYEGNLYLRINGCLYGSIYIRHDAADGHPTVTLGQYDPAAQLWQPRNEIGPEISDGDQALAAADAVVNR